MKASKNPKSTQHPLIDFASRWNVDGDTVCCRSCNYVQHISWAHHDAPHSSPCSNQYAERNPWKTLASLITAGISAAASEDARSRREEDEKNTALNSENSYYLLLLSNHHHGIEIAQRFALRPSP